MWEYMFIYWLTLYIDKIISKIIWKNVEKRKRKMKKTNKEFLQQIESSSKRGLCLKMWHMYGKEIYHECILIFKGNKNVYIRKLNVMRKLHLPKPVIQKGNKNKLHHHYFHRVGRHSHSKPLCNPDLWEGLPSQFSPFHCPPKHGPRAHWTVSEKK